MTTSKRLQLPEAVKRALKLCFRQRRGFDLLASEVNGGQPGQAEAPGLLEAEAPLPAAQEPPGLHATG